jgi:hypothetical protein
MLPFANDSSDMCCDAVLCCLENSVKARALVHSGTCGIGILFSGGLDCMIIAALAARCVADHTVIDLFNVAFDAAEAPDRESACAGFRSCRARLCFIDALLLHAQFSHYVLPQRRKSAHRSSTVARQTSSHTILLTDFICRELRLKVLSYSISL